VVEVSGGPGGVSVDGLRELWAFREVLWAFAVRAFKIKYKQAAIGVSWAIVQPVLTAAIFAVVLGQYAGVPSDGSPYLLFALTGMVLWSYVATVMTTASQSVVDNQTLLRKVFFPREVLPFGYALAALVDLGAALAVELVFLLAYGKFPTVSWIAVVLPISIAIISVTAVSVAFAALNVYYRDVRFLVPFLLQLGLFASAVIYPLSVLPSSWRDLYAVLNPVAGAIGGMRTILVHGDWPNWGVTLGALAWSLVLFVGSYALFKRLERSFADRV
jgi:lipopolysaccharide transport system permease protein